MSRIFVSYRRSDSQAFTDRIHDRLAAEFGLKNVFQDVEFGNIPMGANFPDVLREQVGTCEVVLVIIGPHWIDVREEEHPEVRRILNPNDFVHIEVKTALDRHAAGQALVIPVLVGNAQMPAANDLPENLKSLAVLNAHPVRPNPDFHHDMNLLIQVLRAYFRTIRRGSRLSRPLLVAVAVLSALVVGVLALMASGVIRINATPEPTLNDRAIAMTAIAQNQQANRATNDTATIQAVMTGFVTETSIAESSEIANETATAKAYTRTPTRTDTPFSTPTPNLRATQNAQATLDVQATANVPTSTPQPTASPTPLPTAAPVPTLTPVPPPTENTAATQAALSTQAAGNAQATVDARSTLNAETPVQLQSVYSAEDCSYGGEIQSIGVVDDLTVQFKLCRPDAAFLSKAAIPSMGIYPSEYLQAGGGKLDQLRQPVGTGPYRFDQWDTGNELTLSRYDGYWGTPAVDSNLIMRWNSDSNARVSELEAATVDGIDDVGANDVSTLAGSTKIKLFEQPNPDVFYIGMNNRFSPFSDVRVRQAVAYAIDRQRLIANFFPPGTSIADQFLPPNVFGYTPGVKAYSFDLDVARKLLAEAGYPDGFQVTLAYRDVVRSYLTEASVVAQDIQNQLAQIGIQVTLSLMESGAFLDSALRGKLPFYLLGWSADYPDATSFLDPQFSQGNAQFGDPYQEIADLLSRASSAADPTERLSLYFQANTLLYDEVPLVPISHSAATLAFKSTVSGVTDNPFGLINFASMDEPSSQNFIWMESYEPVTLYCASATDMDSLRACSQISETLVGYGADGTGIIPQLAKSWSVNADATLWTFSLRPGVLFQDGSALDASDVVLSYVVQWDATHPLHDKDSSFTYFESEFGTLLHATS